MELHSNPGLEKFLQVKKPDGVSANHHFCVCLIFSSCCAYEEASTFICFWLLMFFKYTKVMFLVFSNSKFSTRAYHVDLLHDKNISFWINKCWFLVLVFSSVMYAYLCLVNFKMVLF